MIIKTKINKNTKNLNYLHIILQVYIRKYEYLGNISLDYKNNIRLDSHNIIPFNLYNKIIFKYNNTFQQNNKLLSNNIRKNILILCNKISNLTCIGGESFIYPILLGIKKNFNFYSDSKKLVEESVFNYNIYYKGIKNNCKIIDYNNCNDFDCYSNIILNLDCLNKNLLKIINQKKILNIIIINCNQYDFWKKIKILSNFKLKKRFKFYTYSQKYFISTNLLSNKFN